MSPDPYQLGWDLEAPTDEQRAALYADVADHIVPRVLLAQAGAPGSLKRKLAEKEAQAQTEVPVVSPALEPPAARLHSPAPSYAYHPDGRPRMVYGRWARRIQRGLPVPNPLPPEAYEEPEAFAAARRRDEEYRRGLTPPPHNPLGR